MRTLHPCRHKASFNKRRLLSHLVCAEKSCRQPIPILRLIPQTQQFTNIMKYISYYSARAIYYARLNDPCPISVIVLVNEIYVMDFDRLCKLLCWQTMQVIALTDYKSFTMSEERNWKWDFAISKLKIQHIWKEKLEVWLSFEIQSYFS